MSLQKDLENRSGNSCELCSSADNLSVYAVQPDTQDPHENHILICNTCKDLLENDVTANPNHWRSLNDSMWNEHRPVKAVVWRTLNALKGEGWPIDLLNMMYLDDEDMAYVKAGFESAENQIVHKDSNGVTLKAGDSVVLIKDLKVKGSSMVAKQGTAVRRISLDPENEKYIEGKVEGQTIVIITDYVKKI